MDLSSITPQPNSRDHPEVIEWMKRYSAAQRDYVGLNVNDPSNFLDEKDKQDTTKRLYDAVVHTNQELEKWCKHYGIRYGGLKFN